MNLSEVTNKKAAINQILGSFKSVLALETFCLCVVAQECEALHVLDVL